MNGTDMNGQTEAINSHIIPFIYDGTKQQWVNMGAHDAFTMETENNLLLDGLVADA